MAGHKGVLALDDAASSVRGRPIHMIIVRRRRHGRYSGPLLKKNNKGAGLLEAETGSDIRDVRRDLRMRRHGDGT